MVFPEAWREGEAQHLDAVREDFENMGYNVVAQLYEDSDNRRDRHGLMMIGREDLVLESWPVRLAGRTALQLAVYDEQSACSVDVVGVHLDDRLEITRVEQVLSLLEYLEQLWDTVQKRPVVAVGDFNAMKDGMRASILRTVGYVASLLPQLEPGTPKPENMFSMEGLCYIPPRLASLYSRLGGMATGETLRILLASGFRDDNQPHASTATNNFPIAEIDHIVARDADVSDYKVVSNSFTDHRQVRAIITPYIAL